MVYFTAVQTVSDMFDIHYLKYLILMYIYWISWDWIWKQADAEALSFTHFIYHIHNLFLILDLFLEN